jgi:cyclic beta-1,2-glucan synthetase
MRGGFKMTAIGKFLLANPFWIAGGLTILLLSLIPLLARLAYFLQWLLHGNWATTGRPVQPVISEPITESRAHMTDLANKMSVRHQPWRSRLNSLHWRVYYDLQLLRLRLNRTSARTITSTPASLWLFDNYNLLYRELKKYQSTGLQSNLRQLPSQIKSYYHGFPRIFAIAHSLIACTNHRPRPDDIVSLIQDYQDVQALDARELWALPSMLSLALLERIIEEARYVLKTIQAKATADLAADRILAWIEDSESDLQAVLTREIGKCRHIDVVYVTHLYFRLRDQPIDEAMVAHHLIAALGEKETDARWQIEEHSAKERQREASAENLISSMILSLKDVGEMNWEEDFSQVCRLEKDLAADPSGFYSQMDWATRRKYQEQAEKMARRRHLPEWVVAQKACHLADHPPANQAFAVPGHVGTYLLGQGRPWFDQSLRGLEFDDLGRLPKISLKVRPFINSLLFAAGLTGITSGILLAINRLYMQGAGLWPLAQGLLLASLFIPALSIAVFLVQTLFVRMIRPRTQFSLDFTDGIPDDFRTVTVMPVIIDSAEQVRSYADRLERNYLVNRQDNLFFAMLADFGDAATETTPGDAAVQDSARNAINRLNDKYAGGKPRFWLLWRSRQWNPSEQCWMAWERKRGKLEEFNALLAGEAGDEASDFDVLIASPELFPSIRYVITIDADTELINLSAARLAGILAHPLNYPVIDPVSQRILDGYVIVQPEIRNRKSGSDASLFAQVLDGQVGVDPYSSVSADLYQDAFNEGSFYGKGIYDHRVMHQMLRGTIPENRVLSHDLLESSLTRCAYAGSVILMDTAPPGVAAYFKREHRWIRGDWQLLPWLFLVSRVNGLSRWKMFDNLRRSLTSGASVVLILINLWLFPSRPWLWMPFVLFEPAWRLLHLLSGIVIQKLSNHAIRVAYANLLRNLGSMLAHAVLSLTLLPYRATVALDAILRTLFRMLVSQRNLLQWQTSDSVEKNQSNTLKGYIRRMWQSIVIALVLLAAVGRVIWITGELAPELVFAGLVGLSWLLSPWLSFRISTPVKKKPAGGLDADQQDQLMQLARQTWNYFETFAVADTNWLCPDNFQVFPGPRRSDKTSPTNIGLQMLSAASAWKLGFLDVPGLLGYVERTMATVDQLPKWNGHLYNWYNVQTLQLLQPHYVSTVDSGNFVAHAIATKQALLLAKKQLAGGDPLAEQIVKLAERMDQMVSETDFGQLYDTSHRLFHIGYNETAQKLDAGHYDLLASESRLTSLLAIAKGDIPLKHWFALGRPLTMVRGIPTLVSWSGTMFEYLMPNLVLKVIPGSILHASCVAAVHSQVNHGRQQKIPWGISESQHFIFDQAGNYQYGPFGIQRLRLQSSLKPSLVVAPYATVLALDMLPSLAMANLDTLQAAGARGEFGFFEALDYGRPDASLLKPFSLVQSFMTHHQGMSLAAIINLLQDNALPDLFHQEPMIRATEVLLEESQADCLVSLARKGYTIQNDREEVDEESYEPRLSEQTEPVYPLAHILSNGHYSVMLTASGDGFSACDEVQINRWRPDQTGCGSGSFIYVRNLESGQLWSPTFHPTRQQPEHYQVDFAHDRVEYHRRDGTIHTRLDVTLSPAHNLEIRRVTLTNREDRPVLLETTSYLEVVADKYLAEAVHPAFNKLFIESEFFREDNQLIAWRRQRAEEDPTHFVMHQLYTEAPLARPVEFETNRKSFLGRGRSLCRPDALETRLPLAGRAGFSVDPILSLRAIVEVPAGASVTVCYATAYATSREEALKLGRILGKTYSDEHIFALARTSSRFELKFLNITSRQHNTIQNLVGAIYYPTALMRSQSAILSQNTLGQRNLWRLGISGDNPILLLRLSEAKDLPVVKDVLMAYEFLRTQRVKVDLVILNEEPVGYERPLHHRIMELTANLKIHEPPQSQASLFILPSFLLSEAESILLATVARIVFSPTTGLNFKLPRSSKGNRLLQLPKSAPFSEERVAQESLAEPADHPAFVNPDLLFYNGIGGFSPDGREYVMHLSHNTYPPAPWVNVIANDRFGFHVSETGAGYTWSGNSRENKLTTWSNDPVQDPASEAILVKDLKSGKRTSPTLLAIGQPGRYVVRHGFGYSVFTHQALGLSLTLTVFVPSEDPVKLWHLQIQDLSGQPRQLAVTLFVEWVLGVLRDQGMPYIQTGYDPEKSLMWARNLYSDDFRDQVAGLFSSEPIDSFSGNRQSFLGIGGTILNPQALNDHQLDEAAGIGLDPCGAIQVMVDLPAHGNQELVFGLCQEAGLAPVAELASRYQSPGLARQALLDVQAYWQQKLGQVVVKTPDKAFDIMANGWLLYQVLSCRIKARSAFYQCGGAYGFRDQLQDVLACLDTDPARVRSQILRACAHQFREGDVQHWWHEPSGSGIRSRISDDLLWLPFVTAAYVRQTGDLSVLEESIPYLVADLLLPDQAEAMVTPRLSSKPGRVYEHCQKAIERASQTGTHNLPLMGSGDWNDGMNQVGIKGQGESVWLAWFLSAVLRDFARVSERLAEPGQAQKYRQQAQALCEQVERSAWDGHWYVRAFYDDGTPLGSSQNAECQIDSISQSWAVLSDGSDSSRAILAVDSANRYLVHAQSNVIQLLTPPFNHSLRNPGYIMGYFPGVRENGGQYTHAAIWLAMANAKLHNSAEAYRQLTMINPVNATSNLRDALKYEKEPYVVAADILNCDSMEGTGGWTWYTGAAGWYYQAILHTVLGIRREQDKLFVEPAIPLVFASYSVDYRFGDSCYKIQVSSESSYRQPRFVYLLDGQPCLTAHIPLIDDGQIHHVELKLLP